MMLLSRLSCPTKDPPNGPPEYCGLRRAKSLMRSVMVGRVCEHLAVDRGGGAGPGGAEDLGGLRGDRDLLGQGQRGQASARGRSPTPRLTITPLTGLGWKPLRVAVTV